MADKVTITLNGKKIQAAPSMTVAAALAQAGVARFRRSVSGESRSALCGMGICFECRATINNQPHSRTCLTLCEEGMEVTTDE